MVEKSDDCVLKNKAQVVYSYNNSDQIITKITESNTESIQIHRCNYYQIECIKGCVDLSELCLNKQQIYNLSIKGNAELHDYYIEHNNKCLIIRFRLKLRIYYNKQGHSHYYDYYKNYEYSVRFDKNRVSEINITVLSTNYKILNNNLIEVSSVTKFEY